MRRENVSDTDRTTRVMPHALSIDTIITVYPDRGERQGETGRWRITAEPAQYDSWFRLDVQDEKTGDSLTWFVHHADSVAAELAGRAMKAKAADLLADLAGMDLPEVYTWEVSTDGIRGHLSIGSAGYEEARRALEAWRPHIGAEEIVHDARGKLYARVTVRAVMRGVPVEICTTLLNSEIPARNDEGEAAA
jgi:hypothetical protein